MGGAGRRGAEAAASSQPAEAAAQKPLLLVAAAAVPCHSRDQAVARPAPPSEHSAPSPVIIIYSYHSLVFSDGLDIHIYYYMDIYLRICISTCRIVDVTQ